MPCNRSYPSYVAHPLDSRFPDPHFTRSVIFATLVEVGVFKYGGEVNGSNAGVQQRPASRPIRLPGFPCVKHQPSASGREEGPTP